MKTKILVIAFGLFYETSLSGQNPKTNTFFCGYGENNNSVELCNFFKSAPIPINKSAENAVDKILKPLGLFRNFVLVSCPNIQNAIAVTATDGIRYIVYDDGFMKGIDNP
jgi:hypothetical protein